MSFSSRPLAGSTLEHANVLDSLDIIAGQVDALNACSEVNRCLPVQAGDLIVFKLHFFESAHVIENGRVDGEVVVVQLDVRQFRVSPRPQQALDVRVGQTVALQTELLQIGQVVDRRQLDVRGARQLQFGHSSQLRQLFSERLQAVRGAVDVDLFYVGICQREPVDSGQIAF